MTDSVDGFNKAKEMCDYQYINEEYSKELSPEEEKQIHAFLLKAMSGTYHNGVIRYENNDGHEQKWDVFGRIRCMLSSGNSDISAVRHSTVDFWRRPTVNKNAQFLRNPKVTAKMLGETSIYKRNQSQRKTRSLDDFKKLGELREEASKIKCSAVLDITSYLSKVRNDDYKYWHSLPELINTFITNSRDKQLLWSLWIKQAFRRGILLDEMNKSNDPEQLEILSALRTTSHFDTIALSMCNSNTQDKVKDILKQMVEEVPVTTDFLKYNMACIRERELDLKSKTKDVYVCQVRNPTNQDNWVTLNENTRGLINTIKTKTGRKKKRRRESGNSNSSDTQVSLLPPTTAPKQPELKKKRLELSPTTTVDNNTSKKGFLIKKSVI